LSFLYCTVLNCGSGCFHAKLWLLQYFHKKSHSWKRHGSLVAPLIKQTQHKSPIITFFFHASELIVSYVTIMLPFHFRY